MTTEPPARAIASLALFFQHHRRLIATLFIASLFIAVACTTGPADTLVGLSFIPVAALMVIVELNAAPGTRLRGRERWRIRRTRITATKLLDGIANIFVHAIIGCIAFIILSYPRNPGDLTAEFLRLAAGVALLYAVVAIIASVLTVLFLVAGYALPVVHRHPVAARSVEEFWARRWNMVVSAWLHAFVFLPVARRGRNALGIILAFAVSGIFHAWPILFGVGWWAAFTTVLFFTFQGFVILAEKRLRVHTWPHPLAHAWTAIIILGTSPLFIDPGLRLFGL